jgi:hypothetical protein
VAALPGPTRDHAATPPEISPAQEKELRAFVESEHRTSVAVAASFQVSPGATLPDRVNLYQGQVPTVPESPACRSGNSPTTSEV